MGCRFASTALISEVGRIIALVGTDGNLMATGNVFDQIQGNLAFRRSAGHRYTGNDNKAIAVFHQRMAHVAKLGLLPFGFFA